MSDDDIMAGSPLARALDDFAVPGLSAGFADRVVAAAEARAAPLPELRRGNGAGPRRWRLGQRIAIATLGFGALASAAAATGVLERFDIPVPSPQKVWASMTGTAAPAAPAAAVPATSAPAAAPAALAPVVIDGPIDTPEELGEAFRRIDEVRAGRSEARRQIIDQRIDRAIERRRAAGLPAPNPEQEARLRQRIEAAQATREAKAVEQIEARRQELRLRVDNGEALTRETIAPQRLKNPDAPPRVPRVPRLRDLTPAQRRELLRSLPPEDRRAVTEEVRRRREERRLRNAPQSGPAGEGAGEGAVEAQTPATTATEPSPPQD